MRLAARLVAALVLGAATTALPVAPAQAAACPSGDGVTVVVDYHELGGGVAQVCDSGGAGKTAAAQLTAAGFALTRVQRQPGFVCRVEGKPVLVKLPELDFVDDKDAKPLAIQQYIGRRPIAAFGIPTVTFRCCSGRPADRRRSSAWSSIHRRRTRIYPGQR